MKEGLGAGLFAFFLIFEARTESFGEVGRWGGESW